MTLEKFSGLILADSRTKGPKKGEGRDNRIEVILPVPFLSDIS